MIVRSPLHSWPDHPELYYRSVTAHGSAMVYVFPILIAMGFGYAICVTALQRPLVGLKTAWLAFWLVVMGTLLAVTTVASGHASVLYTFYPPLVGHAGYY